MNHGDAFKSSKDVKHSLDPQKIHTRALDLVRQAATQSDSWQLHDAAGERRQGAGTPHEAIDTDNIRLMGLKKVYAHNHKELTKFHESYNEEYLEASKHIESMHSMLETSLDSEHLDNFKKRKEDYIENKNRLNEGVTILNNFLTSMNEEISQSIQDFSSTSEEDIAKMMQEIKQKCANQEGQIKKFYAMSMDMMKQHISELQEFEKLAVKKGTIEDIKQAHNRKRDQDNIDDFQKKMRICKECNEIYDDIDSKILNIRSYDEKVQNLDDNFRTITSRIINVNLSLEEGDYSKLELNAAESLKKDLEGIQGKLNDMLQKDENLPS